MIKVSEIRSTLEENILDWEVTQPLGKKGVCIKWYQSIILLADSKQMRGDKRTQSCTLCVTDSQHNATEQTSGATLSQSGCRNGNVRALCNIRGDGGNAEKGT
jgi:uncharacterized protein with beta-barrel porin domain